jgi:hypothetical protein
MLDKFIDLISSIKYVKQLNQKKKIGTKRDQKELILGALCALLVMAFIPLSMIGLVSSFLYLLHNTTPIESNDFPAEIHLSSGPLKVDHVLAYTGNISIPQNETENATIQIGTLGENGSIVTLPPYAQLEDRRH